MERREMKSSPSGSPVSLVFWCQERLMGTIPSRVKLECKNVDPCENSRAVHISPHNAGTVTDSERSIKANRKLTFQRAISQGRASPLTSPKWGSDTQIWRFSHKFSQKGINCLLQSSLSTNFQRHSCSAINYLYRTVSTLSQGMTPFS